MQTLARWLARAGWAVRSLSTNATEAADSGQGLSTDFIRSQGSESWPGKGPLSRSGSALIWEADGVQWHWFATNRQHQWELDVGAAYDQHLQVMLSHWRPQLVLTFGDDPGDQRRRRWCRAAGAKLVFALHNLAYLGRPLPDVDRFLAPSQFLAERYRAQLKAPLDVLPMPVELADLASGDREPLSVLFVNPEAAKGRQLVARVAAHLVRHRPDIPLMVVTGRDGPGPFLQAVQHCGADTTKANNLVLVTKPQSPREVFRWCRVCLVPSVVEESGGRVVVEAQSVGAVPLVSSRGALPETVGTGGMVLPLPHALLANPNGAITQDEAQPWIDAVIRLMDDEACWQALSAQALDHAGAFHAAQGVPRYDAWARACAGVCVSAA